MANTVIALKKSGTTSAAPLSLANGELAINYADGKLFYKNVTGSIVAITSGGASSNSFATINANGSLITAVSNNSTLTFVAGQNIGITSDIINDIITLDANLTPANNFANTKLSNGTVTLAGSLTTTEQMYVNSQITITPLGGSEGGEIRLDGSGNYTDWSLDSYQNNFRVFTITGSTVSNVNFFHAGAGSIRMGVNKADPAYTVDVAGDVNITGTYRVNGTPIASGGSMDYAYVNLSTGSANAWANSVGASGNNYASILISNTAAAINANAAYSYAAINAYSLVTEAAGNNYTSVLVANTSAAINANASASYTSINNNATIIGTSGNNYASVLVANIALSINSNASASYTSINSYSTTIGTAGNNYASVLVANTAAAINANAAYSYAAINAYSLVTEAAGNNYASVLVANTAAAINSYISTSLTSTNNYTNYVGASSNTYANNTFVKLVAPTQTITGDLAITGNLTFLGNSTIISSNSLVVGDSLIYLAANNYSGTDILDIGFLANYANGTGANVHTGLIRDATTKQYYLFQGLDIELQANNTAFTPGANGVTNATLNADLVAGNVTVAGINVYTYFINTAAGANNFAGVLANNVNANVATGLSSTNNYASILAANNALAGNNYTSVLVANTAAAINANASASYAAINAYSLVTEAAGNNYASVLVANTAAAINANTSASYAAINAYALSIVTAANNWANTKIATVTSNSNSRVWANTVVASGIETVYIDLANSGVIAGVYGNSSIIPIITVDAYGRVTSIANVTSAGGGGASVNVGNTAPVSPTVGNLWWDTDSGRMYIYYTDADSSQWVDASPTQNPATVGGYYLGNRGAVGTIDALGDIFRVHSNTMTSNVTIPDGYNAIAAGPLTVQNGINLTVGLGSRTVIV